jgi:hypothetical protein
MSSNATKEYTFTIFVEKVEGSALVAHALEAGLVATADSTTDVLSKLSRMLVRQIEFAEKNNNPGDIYHPCEKAVWDRFSAAQHNHSARKVSKSSNEVRVDHGEILMLNQYAYAAG